MKKRKTSEQGDQYQFMIFSSFVSGKSGRVLH